LDLIGSIRDSALRADRRLRPLVLETPLLRSRLFDGVQYKLETVQRTRAFKYRGALNKLLSLADGDAPEAVVTASTGNHGAAVAVAASERGMQSHVFIPDNVAGSKLWAITTSGAQVQRITGDPLQAEIAARSFAEDMSFPYISPYNDPEVIAGQATIGVELQRQLEHPPDAVFIPVGGGGLISGVAIAIEEVWPSTRVVGCSPVNSCVMARSVEAGRVVDTPSSPTLSDGTAGGIEKDTITFELCARLVDEFVLVTEDEIAGAFVDLIEKENFLVEGAAATALAGYRKIESATGGNAVVLLTGANVSRKTLVEVLSAG
jgi:threonine dehydratase